MSKLVKAQIQLGESIAVIVIVVIIIIIGIAFWGKVTQRDTKDSFQQAQVGQLIELSKVVSELPELKCYSTEKVTKVNCFDWYKILAMANASQDSEMRDAFRNYYTQLFGSSKISFEMLYPEVFNVTIYDYNISQGNVRASVPIMIPIVIEQNLGREGPKYFGLLVVEGYFR